MQKYSFKLYNSYFGYPKCWVVTLIWMKIRGFPGGLEVEKYTGQCRRHRRHGFNTWIGKILWSRKWQPTPVFLPEKSQGQRSLSSYSPWVHQELNTTEHTHSQLEFKSYARELLIPGYKAYWSNVLRKKQLLSNYHY